MPLPFILGGLALAAGLAGVKKAVDASNKNDEAKSLQSSAEWIVDISKEQLDEAKTTTDSDLKELGRTKVRVLTEDVNRFLRTFQQIHHITLSRSEGLDELAKFQVDEGSLAEMKDMGSIAESVASGIGSGAAAGSLAAFGAYSGAMWLGAASTGTAISTLSGVAATNATLAFLGGGSLAAGGLGIVGGTAVLGGLVAGPALAVMGFMMNSKAEENLEKARGNLEKAYQISEELDAAREVCEAISARTTMFNDLLNELSNFALPQIKKMERTVRRMGTDFREYEAVDKENIAIALSTMGAIKKVLDTPILTKQGNLTAESKKTGREVRQFLNQAQ